MTEKQLEFLCHYSRTGDAEASALRAGYPPGSGARVLDSASVKNLVRALGITDCRQMGRRVVRELEQVAFDQAGDGSGSELKYASKLKALELLGKYAGVWEPGWARDPDQDRGPAGVVVLPEVITSGST